MITYVTCDDVDNAFGNAWTSENAKNKAVLMANAYGFSSAIASCKSGSSNAVLFAGNSENDFDTLTPSRIDGINILHGDLKLTALVCEVTDKPAVDHIIEIYDPVSRQLQRYEVINGFTDNNARIIFLLKQLTE